MNSAEFAERPGLISYRKTLGLILVINGNHCDTTLVVRTDVRDVSCHLPVFVKVFGNVLAP